MYVAQTVSGSFLLFMFMPSYTFRKEEKLCSQKVIGEIFLTGTSFLCYPLKVVWKYENLDIACRAQVLFSVPKRLFKRATDRNLLKRRLREVYRYRKLDLYQLLELNERKIVLMIVYIAQEELEYAQIEASMAKIISNFKKILQPI